ncbi:ABC-type metal ion transport system, periplasmic component/surface adhesin [Bernardetia litoralis DSM 6794]|uniref:ABC-type metal ion transport system, periplasmic component/surface adhesin n=2 Tax=Bernardetia litoralis TaxID=999 RepID=I4APN4_BERLS|nr:ABC-type metal ion transport system, periplasmic component/surface adhesin [Bernardetia litoralis DSM 6794]
MIPDFKTILSKLVILFPILLIFSLASCIEKKSEQTSDEVQGSSKKLEIVCTTGMIADMIKNIVGDSANVEALMGVGVDPHLYKATQNDVSRLTEADMIFYNGLHLEGKMAEILEKFSSQKSVTALGDAIDESVLREVGQNTHDPHIWMSVALWKQTIPSVVEALSKKQPSNAAYFEKQAAIYAQKLEGLDKKVKAQILEIPENQRVLITSHDAFYYFGKEYAMEVQALQGISTASEAGISDMNNLVNFIVERKIKAIFVESSISPQAINAVLEGAKNKGADVKIGGTLFSDAMGATGTPEENYIGMIEFNATKMVEALK